MSLCKTEWPFSCRRTTAPTDAMVCGCGGRPAVGPPRATKSLSPYYYVVVLASNLTGLLTLVGACRTHRIRSVPISNSAIAAALFE